MNEQPLFFVVFLVTPINQPDRRMSVQVYTDLRFEPLPCPSNHKFVIDAIEGGQLKIAVTDGFELKSKRISPYFFNSGLYVSGSDLARLSQMYADKLNEVYGHRLENCVLFGPPYKGIALANLTAIQLHGFHSREALVASNRKETKDHGEGGLLMGADMSGRDVIIIDDVITDGKSKREGVELIRAAGGNLIGGIIALDRQERGKDSTFSGVQQFEMDFGVPMDSIATFNDVIEVFRTYPAENSQELYNGILPKLCAYRDQYGATL